MLFEKWFKSSALALMLMLVQSTHLLHWTWRTSVSARVHWIWIISLETGLTHGCSNVNYRWRYLSKSILRFWMNIWLPITKTVMRMKCMPSTKFHLSLSAQTKQHNRFSSIISNLLLWIAPSFCHIYKSPKTALNGFKVNKLSTKVTERVKPFQPF